MVENDGIFTNIILQTCRGLSPEYQQAVLWLIEHFDYVDAVINGIYIPSDELDESINYAKNNDEYTLHVLLLMKKQRMCNIKSKV